MSTPLPTYFLSHGGGPWPFMEGAFRRHFDRLESVLAGIPAELAERPRAVLVVTAHWEGESFRVSSHPRPPMVYDYSGFPPHTYQAQYPAPGDPALAAEVVARLQTGGVAAAADSERGFDHGSFSTVLPMYPQADMPLVQLSLQRSLDPTLHLRAGQLLAPLRAQGVLILGSGLSFHNLRAFDARSQEPSRQFDDWLQQALRQSPAARRQALIDWAQAPQARFAHPREDHLLPLMVAAGAAEDDPAQLHYHQQDFMGGLAVSGFRFG
ncbi:aromatic ring-opening dioxygenase catalytic subunit (LigB family) [Inhella inkyongensis]|uniref:Aromatic ring-opening dioxygenase catalytic subunit (LigB family) n=1 Tax=Inhella inkyongensis TaxID=392593 RepID=A0A840RXE4_9BURK|nr:class III extradiol ring-cleavage dioxygenase [Inhella inkyongensis]MBB5203377.1 aromatic ring-opening dioxygenase catalytic subunit (LigB family) [Inhella inkyongensis]